MIAADKRLLARFQRVNRLYFNGQYPLNEIKWSLDAFSLIPRKKCWAAFSPLQIVIINICLRGKCPNYVLEYLIYHECLHRYWFYHCQSFKKEELKFRHFQRAETWLKKHESLIKAGRW